MSQTPSDPSPSKPTRGNIFFVGLLSFFGGISQDMFTPILPLYLANVLGMSRELIGLSEGVLTAGASLFKIVSGFLSDKFKKQKPIIFIGYFLSMISRPLLAILTSTTAVIGLRFVDGIGKGVKDAPKDVLIAGSSEKKTRGKSFGIARMLDTLGSVAGPLLLFALLELFKNSPRQYHNVLLFTAVPLLFTLAVLIFKVKELPAAQSEGGSKTAPLQKPRLSRNFWIFLGITSLFTLGNSSDAFLILRAQSVGVTLLAIPLVFALFNFVYAIASVPLGSLSDRIGREKVIFLGWLAYAIAYVGFALATNAVHIWILYAFYGLYYATTYGVAKAFIADLVDASHRGRAYSIYNTIVGLLALPASIMAGWLWDSFGPRAPFLVGALIAGSASILLIGFMSIRKPAENT